jgi:hypothetical protein
VGRDRRENVPGAKDLLPRGFLSLSVIQIDLGTAVGSKQSESLMEVDDRDQPEREWQQQKEAELQGSAAARHQEEMQRLAGLQRFAQAEAELRRCREEEAAARLYEEAIAARHHHIQ